jgi:aryl-alcohol dehydrogenase-like predicted oxidoreductase
VFLVTQKVSYKGHNDHNEHKGNFSCYKRKGIMEKRKLGQTAIEVAPLCFGGNVFGWTIDEATSFELLDAFEHAGYNFIDTADSYSNWVPGNKGGESETIIGNWMKQKGNRSKMIIATKLGSDLGGGKKGLSRAYMFKEVETSLQRLRTDYIDLYQAHYDDPGTPIEETIQAFDELVKQGKVRTIGASNFSAERMKASLEISSMRNLARYQTLQPLYNLYDRKDFEMQLQSLCLEEGISVIPYFSLASGFLTGKYKSESDFSKSKRGGGMKKYINDRGFRIIDALEKLAAEYDTTPAVIALAWLKQRPAVLAPIASATNKQQLNELIASTALILNDEAMEALNKASEL